MGQHLILKQRPHAVGARDRLETRLNDALMSLELTLDSIRHGLMLIGAQGEVRACNAIALRLLGLPVHLLQSPFKLSDVMPQLDRLGVTLGPDQDVVELETEPGRHIRIRATSAGHYGAAIVIEDVSARRNGKRAQHVAIAEYRSLFENAVCGIYRDQLDGTPVRCNPALAALNGYASEAEYISAVTGAHGAWYVEEGRRDEFRRLMQTEGRVKDFVSEVYRHKTRERIWITENAWFVRDADDAPLFIEGTIQDATERMTAMAAIARHANLDSLTGAASRFRFLHEIEAMTEQPLPGCALFSIDLDRFKEVNDILGHAAGDDVLRESARRLNALVDGNSLVARQGGDEFAILVPALRDRPGVEALAGSIATAMREPMAINGQNLIFGASIGATIFPDQAANAEELLVNADLALYHVKAAGRDGYRVFDGAMRAGMQRRKEIEQDLRLAIGRDELELFYQPIVESASGKVQGYEALMRWNHPKRGFLPPVEFIPVAEEAGLMTELGNWAIARACSQAIALPPHVQIAVNVSPSQFRSATIIAELRNALESSGLDPSRLILEVTETVILSSETIAGRVMDELLAMGVHLALDDFGTGYSSLSYLQRFAFNKVKIDRSFVSGMLEKPASLAIIRAILGIGQDLGIGVVAEGVETLAQADALRREGCQLLQGYYFGKPKPYIDVISDLAVAGLGQMQTEMSTRPDFARTG